jgi:hypothetical protein
LQRLPGVLKRWRDESRDKISLEGEVLPKGVFLAYD